MIYDLPALGSSLTDGIIGLAVSFMIVTYLMPRLIQYFRGRGIIGADVHKPDRPQVAEMGGAAIVIGLLAGLASVALCIQFLYFRDLRTAFPLALPNGTLVSLNIYRASTLTRILELGLVVGAVALVGLYDDLSPLKGRQKPVFTLLFSALAFSPIVLNYYLNLRIEFANDPRLLSFAFVPFVQIPGRVAPVSLTILFPLIALFAVTICANAMNMMDVYNGIMPATTAIVAVAMMISAVILERFEAFYLLLPFLGAVLAYYRFNRYPARVFSGDVGSLSVGAGLAAIAFLSRLEVVFLIAFIPFILNGMDTLLTVGFKERRDMGARPTMMTEDGKIALNPNPRAPVPLANLFLLDGPKTEKELIRDFIGVVVFSAALSILTAFIMILPSPFG